jgi:asparaginyl-tRNA synthetase
LYCLENGFKIIDAPHFTNATGACENFLTIFDVDFFGKPAYMSQTGQLYLEAFLPKFEKTCCLGPSFRKEDVVDNRHAVEFTLLEIEIANCDLEKLKKHIEGIFTSMVQEIIKCESELEILGIDKEWPKNFLPPFNSITYSEAVKKLGLDFGEDLKDRHEKELVRLNNQKPLFVTHYPQEIKFFNMRLNRQNPKVVNSMDLLLPFSGEAIGAAEREEDYEILLKRLKESKMLSLMFEVMKNEPGMSQKTKQELEENAVSRFLWYLNLIKKHPIRHAGCGMGKSRIVQSFLASNDIRASSAYPLNKETLM